MDPLSDPAPPDRSSALARLCWRAEHLRADTVAAAAGRLVDARDALLHAILQDYAALAAIGPAQAHAPLSLCRSTR